MTMSYLPGLGAPCSVTVTDVGGPARVDHLHAGDGEVVDVAERGEVAGDGDVGLAVERGVVRA